jgi:hypothetical protein
MALLWVDSASAAVSLVGPDGCLSAEALDLETRSTLGDTFVDRYDIVATLAPEPDHAWEIRLEVSESGAPLWRRNLHVVQADCPYVASLVAVSIERGLSKVPDLEMPGFERQRHVTEGGFLVSFMVPADERIGVGTYLSVGLTRPFRLEVSLEGFVGLPQEVGAGRVQLYGVPLAYGGLAYETRSRGDLPSFRLALRAGGGLVVGGGEDFGPVADGVALNPHGSAIVDTIFAFGKQFRVGPRGEWAFARIRLVDVNADPDVIVEEPVFRVGLTAAYAWPVVRH